MSAVLPELRVALIAPEPLLNEREFLRVHNRSAKNALRREALFHWIHRIPRHFQADAAAKYGYMPRKPKYLKIKERYFGSTIDLVRSGKTRDSITRNEPEIRIGGKAANDDGSIGQLKLTMKMRLPFGVDAQSYVKKSIDSGKYRQKGQTSFRTKPGVTIDQMKREISAITLDEANEIASSFGKQYVKTLAYALKNRPKIRKRIAEAHLGDILGF